MALAVHFVTESRVSLQKHVGWWLNVYHKSWHFVQLYYAQIEMISWVLPQKLYTTRTRTWHSLLIIPETVISTGTSKPSKTNNQKTSRGRSKTSKMVPFSSVNMQHGTIFFISYHHILQDLCCIWLLQMASSSDAFSITTMWLAAMGDQPPGSRDNGLIKDTNNNLSRQDHNQIANHSCGCWVCLKL